MKSLFQFLLMSLIFCFSCSDDEVSADLNYDGDNFSAPLFVDQEVEAGTRFPATITGAYVGSQLTEVEFYIENIPSSSELFIYGAGTASSPGPILYQAVQNGLSSSSWNSHTLSTPVEITESDLWICLRAVHNGSTSVIGCDAGPAVANGDWIKVDGGSWQTLRDFSADVVNINWNIRGFVSN